MCVPSRHRYHAGALFFARTRMHQRASARGPTAPADALVTRLATRAPSVRTATGGFRPSARTFSRMAAACGQRPWERVAHALGSARTFGANRNRGLPPVRSHFQPHGGSLRATPLRTRCPRPRQRAHLRCESQPGASARPLALSAAGLPPNGIGFHVF
jgi:hypothetical protein